MLQTRFISGDDMSDLERNLNDALRSVKGKPTVKYFETSWTAVIETEIESEYEKRLCCECSLWDDGGSSSSLSGFCTMTGQRKRYNCRACEEYKDVRG